MSVVDGTWYVYLKGDYAGRVSGAVYDLRNSSDPVKLVTTVSIVTCLEDFNYWLQLCLHVCQQCSQKVLHACIHLWPVAAKLHWQNTVLCSRTMVVMCGTSCI